MERIGFLETNMKIHNSVTSRYMQANAQPWEITFRVFWKYVLFEESLSSSDIVGTNASFIRK